jgi:hypothetical protein
MFQEHLDAIGGDLLDWLWAHVHAAIIIERNDVQAQLSSQLVRSTWIGYRTVR